MKWKFGKKNYDSKVEWTLFFNDSKFSSKKSVIQHKLPTNKMQFVRYL